MTARKAERRRVPALVTNYIDNRAGAAPARVGLAAAAHRVVDDRLVPSAPERVVASFEAEPAEISVQITEIIREDIRRLR